MATFLLLALLVSQVYTQGVDEAFEQIQELRESIGHMSELRESISQMEKTIDVLQKENSAINTKLQKWQNSTLLEGPVVFSAIKTSTQTVSSGDVIQFDYEFIDTHGLFNENIGIFTVPQTGIYELTVTIFKYTSLSYNSIYCDLYVGETFLTRIYNRYSSDTTAAAHGTSSIIREFQIGNSVYVRSSSSGSVYGSTSYRATQFSGKYLGPVP